ncbi:MAG: CDP-alcohol phosphatidyltransferase family protein [Anaerolineales bacterium]|nr:CDP-alcohol phosphatidyltransferase family protein [Anaerolineales bacterium]
MIKEEGKEKETQTFTGFLRKFFNQPLNQIGARLVGWGINANLITAIGFAGTAAGAVLVSQGKLLAGGLVIGAMGALDALDGAVARAAGETSLFGAFLDSVCDRYSELAIYTGIGWYFLGSGNQLGVLLSFLAACGSVLVSYTRARAEGLGMGAKVGILTRVERMIVIMPALILNLPLLGVGIVAVLANVTAFQRILHVWQQAMKEDEA